MFITPDLYRVAQDGKPVSPEFSFEDEAWTWLLRNQPMSTSWAIQYEGYSIQALDPKTNIWVNVW